MNDMKMQSVQTFYKLFEMSLPLPNTMRNQHVNEDLHACMVEIKVIK